MASLEELQAALAENLHARGVTQRVKAHLQHEVLSTLHSDAAPVPRPPPEALLINDLIREYLAWTGYDHALAVFNLETGHPPEPSTASAGAVLPPATASAAAAMGLSRTFVAEEVDVVDSPASRAVPLLYSVVATAQATRAARLRDARAHDAAAAGGVGSVAVTRLHHTDIAALPGRTTAVLPAAAGGAPAARALVAATGEAADRGAAASLPSPAWRAADDTISSADSVPGAEVGGGYRRSGGAAAGDMDDADDSGLAGGVGDGGGGHRRPTARDVVAGSVQLGSVAALPQHAEWRSGVPAARPSVHMQQPAAAAHSWAGTSSSRSATTASGAGDPVALAASRLATGAGAAANTRRGAASGTGSGIGGMFMATGVAADPIVVFGGSAALHHTRSQVGGGTAPR